MSNVVKWGLLTAGLIALIGLIMALPFVGFIDFNEFSNSLSNILNVIGGGLHSARGLINNFLTPTGRNILSGILVWLFGKWAITVAIKIVAWVYHFIFRG